MIRMHDLGWWYWFLTAGLLATGLAGRTEGGTYRIALAAIEEEARKF